jgi:hypothetical protein
MTYKAIAGAVEVRPTTARRSGARQDRQRSRPARRRRGLESLDPSPTFLITPRYELEELEEWPDEDAASCERHAPAQPHIESPAREGGALEVA